MKYLDWLDLVMFVGMLIVSAVIGIYFGYFAADKQNTTSQYLMGGKTMGIFPVSMSLIASYISGISILGLPSEMYVYGTQYSMIVLSEVLVSVTMAYVYLPVFYTLQITSSYEYLNKRFSSSVKILGSCIFVLKMMLYIPIVIYVPALALNQVTGVSLHLVTPAVCLICIFYTTLGGLKAVVWTDTFQIMIMMLGIVAVLIMGLVNVGGFGIVLERAAASNRLEFLNMDPDPRTRHTIWSVVFGNYFFWLASCSANQAMVQRCLSLPNIRKANIAIGILAVGIIVIVGLCCFTGLIIYATYHQCDPITAKRIKKPDQILPFFVMEMAGNIPGLPGIFLSGVFSAALSTMSTGLNSMTGVIFEDMIKPFCKSPVTESRASTILKIVVVIIGVICVAMVFVVERLGTLIQAGKSLSGITAGPLLGMFSLGMFFPWANEKGALIGGIVSLITTAWISINSQKEITLGNIVFPKKPVSTDGCPADLMKNITLIDIEKIKIPSVEPFPLFEISYLWYTFTGTAVAIIVGLAISYISGFNDPKLVDKDLITPVVQKFFYEEKKEDNNEMKSKTTS
ncbi:sodium-coupled monocarboxylate transporter 1-like [Planococcus citri]|uniref:sodium-coupled monocarboxylate transporter 1-like n=1 Tax=Planococcus citri TaxID=170843 RepID=UPI0031F9509F